MTSDTRPNIVFLVMDTCRADTFHQLLDQGRLPGVKRIAEDATVYRNAMSAAPWTVPSHGTMFSGLYPTDHGTSANNPYFDPPTTPLAERLRAAGYETIGLSANPWITPNFDFSTGFDRFRTENELFWGGADISGLGKLSSRREQFSELLSRMSLSNAPQTLVNIGFRQFFAQRTDSGAKHLMNTAIDWLKGRRSSDPFFLFCNFTEPHLEYDPPQRFAVEELPSDVDVETARSVSQEQWEYVTGEIELSQWDFELLRSLYRGSIRYLDSQLGRLFDCLIERNLLDETAVVLVSDHGENIGDHGLMDHQYCLYETLLHVPLVIRYPPSFTATSTNRMVETRQLYETLSRLAGLEASSHDTAPPLDDGETIEYAIAEYTSPQPSIETLEEEYGPLDDDVRQYDRALRSIRTERWKFIEGSDGLAELYDLHADPDEMAPVANDSVQTELRDVLYSRRGTLADPNTEYADINAASREQLRDLGYL